MYTFWQGLSLFFIYSFLGWCIEVTYSAKHTKTYDKRGFLYGPICPLYGFAIMTAIFLLEPKKDAILSVFFISSIIATIFELIMGIILKRINKPLWDYSNNKFNLKGYICLKFSFLWGIGCLIILYMIHPVVLEMIQVSSYLLIKFILIVLVIIYGMDVIMSNIKINIKYKDIISKYLNDVSRTIGTFLSKGTVFILKERK